MGTISNSDKINDEGNWFGLPKPFLIGAYLTAICLTGMAIQAADPLQQMMKLNQAYSNITDDNERSNSIASVVGLGISCSVLSGIVVGPLIEILGPKITSLIGMAVHGLGYFLMFFTNAGFFYNISAVCFGFAYQLIKNSHVSTGCLYPSHSNLILTLLSASCDLSMIVPSCIFALATFYGNGSDGVRKAVMQYLMICVTSAAIIELLLLPMKPFSNNYKILESEKQFLVSKDVEAVPDKKVVAVPRYAHLSLKQQLCTAEYWLFVVMITLAFCRKTHFSLLIRPILFEMDSDPLKIAAVSYVNMYNRLVPFGFIPAIVWGAIVDRIGINKCIFASNILGTLFIVFSLVPSLPVQNATIIIYIIYQCFIIGQTLSFIASVYGFRTLPTLQGICCFIIGAFSMLMNSFWPRLINQVLGSYRVAGYVWLVVSLLMFILPMFIVSSDWFKLEKTSNEG